jgi:hypothetical protein
MSTRRVRLGEVGVDSGQLIIIDPCYVDGEWRREEDAKPLYVKVWGRDVAKVALRLREAGWRSILGRMEYNEPDGLLRVWPIQEEPSPGQMAVLMHKVREHAKSYGLLVVTAIQTDSTYDRACEAAMGPNQGGELTYQPSQASGLAVVFQSGLGDGTYEVFATIQDLGTLGPRITRVEIELIPDLSQEMEA